jgi:hypothetical protein
MAPESYEIHDLDKFKRKFHTYQKVVIAGSDMGEMNKNNELLSAKIRAHWITMNQKRINVLTKRVFVFESDLSCW